jgi:hypothetical protein
VDTDATVEVLLETTFSAWSVPKSYKEDNWSNQVSERTHVEAGSNTSTVTLRVAGGDEMENLKSETVKYGRESQGTRTRERPYLSDRNKYLVMGTKWGSTPRITY